jgi:triacylglycerol lipase
MASMADHLADKGYRVVNRDYPSTQASIQTLSQDIVTKTVRRCRSERPSAPVHFVTHSLGGILVRYYLQAHRLPPGSRVVMLSPPNQGSEIADLLKDNVLYRWIMGPAGQQLGTGADAIPNRLENHFVSLSQASRGHARVNSPSAVPASPTKPDRGQDTAPTPQAGQEI